MSQNGEVKVGKEVQDKMTTKADKMLRRITELKEKLVREEGRRPVASPALERPTGRGG